jgi:N-acetyl-anhydromuramyl-L-alanine amidase AmpD
MAADQAGELWFPSPHHSSREGTKPRLIVVHAAEGIVDVERLGLWFADPASMISTHAGADAAGRLGRYVPSELAAWSVRQYNRVALSIMLCTVPGAAVRYSPHDWFALRPMLDTAAAWVGREAAAAGIRLVKLDTDPARLDDANGVCGFGDLIDGRSDVGPAFPWHYLLERAFSLDPGGQR